MGIFDLSLDNPNLLLCVLPVDPRVPHHQDLP